MQCGIESIELLRLIAFGLLASRSLIRMAMYLNNLNCQKPFHVPYTKVIRYYHQEVWPFSLFRQSHDGSGRRGGDVIAISPFLGKNGSADSRDDVLIACYGAPWIADRGKRTNPLERKCMKDDRIAVIVFPMRLSSID
jgi:hypothetical protein